MEKPGQARLELVEQEDQVRRQPVQEDLVTETAALLKFTTLWHSCTESERRAIAEIVNDPQEWRGTAPSCPYKEIAALYHRHCPMLPRIRGWYGGRKAAMARMWREMPSLEEWEAFFVLVSKSDFLTGRDSRGGRDWRADLDWLMKPANFWRTVEGRHR